MTRNLASVRQKIFLSAVLTSLVALLVSGASLFAYDLHAYRQASAASLAVEAELLGSASSAALQFDDSDVATANLAFLKARPTGRAAALYTPRGELFATYVRKDVPRQEIPPAPGVEGIAHTSDRIAGFHRLQVGNDFLGTVYLAEDLEIGKRVWSYAVIALTVMVVALGVSALISAWIQRGITRPITRMSELAREVVATRNYSARAVRTTRDEIGTLADAFNEMLAEIQRRTAAIEASNEEIVRLNRDLERRVAERTAQLEETNLQLQSANTAKSSFLSMMSHEIRTPMNGVLGMLELLSLSTLDPNQRTTLEIVRASGRSLLRIIDDILDFSKIEAGKLEVRPEVASIARLVGNVAAIYSGNASSKALVLKAHVDPRISPAVHVDPLRLQQILNNLVSNAIKFTSKGSVEIRAELVERRAGVDLVSISVTDTGIGISTQAQAALFQPFSQADGDVARVFGGTGLGLSIGRRLASLMGGTIAISSQPGSGTVATVTLPLPIADPGLLPSDQPRERDAVSELVQARRPAPSTADAEAEGRLVLVVDDHPINRTLLMRQVKVLGYAAEEADNGREALELWKSGRFGLIVTDVNMPEMDGYELTRSIRTLESRGGNARTPVIACTANALPGEVENCFAAGMDDYIAKPVDLARLAAKLDQWLPLPHHDAPPPLDRSVLGAIVAGDEALEREVLAEFVKANEEDVVLLERALEERDVEEVAREAHRIKGATAAIGALDLAKVCALIEAAARAGDWSAIFAQRDTFRHEVARLNEHLETLAGPT
jgi:signal transduction histidine kinase/CheY-like chemotaxis protein/HPt (histidine-containing phosphotransfer) domain-containing protein